MTRTVANGEGALCVNVDSGSADRVEAMLSNLAEARFVLDGIPYRSVEGFWSSLKYPAGDPGRAKAAQSSGTKAKRAGRKCPRPVRVSYGGEPFEAGSPAHRELMFRALRAKFGQNAEHRRALLGTRDAYITHVLMRSDGTPVPDSVTIPRAIFADMLMAIRDELAGGG